MTYQTRRAALFSTAALALAAAAWRDPARAAPLHGTLYKNPQCDCCEGYASYLRASGYDIEVQPTNDLDQMSEQAGIPEKLQGCHLMMLGGYVVSGHVPVEGIRTLLRERPALAAITLPGMPQGAPGMSGEKQGPFTVYAIPRDGGAPTVFATF